MSYLVSLFFILLTIANALPGSPTPTTKDLIRRQGSGAVTGPGLAWYDPSLTNGSKGKANPSLYVCYKGPATNFPPRSSWASFETSWALQKQYALTPIGDSATEAADIRTGILQISKAAKVDARVILALMINESTGNVRVRCTTSPGGVQNCGLMQSYNPDDKAYNPKTPQVSITQMIKDGTQGTRSGPGMVQWFNGASNVNANSGGNLYKSLRGYNSGNFNSSNLSDGLGATDAHVSNVANFLMGWNGRGAGPGACTFVQPKPSPTPTPTPTPAACSSTKYAPPPSPTASGTTPDCCAWYVVKSGDTCGPITQQYGISLSQFYSWNKYVDSNCDNLWVDTAYCVSSNDPVSS